MADYEIRTRRFTRAEYERLIDLGVFQPGEDIELIGGELMVAEPQGAPHYTAIRKTAKALEAAFGPGWDVRTEGPIGLDDESEPEPDVAVVPGGPDDYARAHPRVPSSRSRWPSRAWLSIGSARAVSTPGPVWLTTGCST
jgi:Uma2 family endonuclease